MRVLLIEDDAKTADYVRTGLAEAGHVVDVVSDGRDGVSQAMSQDYDILILDRTLPYLDGLTIAKTVRAARSGTPILFLTALGSVNERVEGEPGRWRSNYTNWSSYRSGRNGKKHSAAVAYEIEKQPFRIRLDHCQKLPG